MTHMRIAAGIILTHPPIIILMAITIIMRLRAEAEFGVLFRR